MPHPINTPAKNGVDFAGTGSLHPTKQKLVQTVVNLLRDRSPQDITVEEVLNGSGVSSGSLYHHFSDLGDLLDHSLAFLYASFVDSSIRFMNKQVEGADTLHDYRNALHFITESTQGSAFVKARATRAWIIAESTTRPGLRKLLQLEQDRLTHSISMIAEHGKAQGWVRPDIDSLALANFIQAYTLGHIVDDVSFTHMDIKKWIALINDFTDRCILASTK